MTPQHQDRAMRIKYRNIGLISLGILLALTIYLSSPAHSSAQVKTSSNSWDSDAPEDINRWQDRAPRSLSKDYDPWMNENQLENENRDNFNQNLPIPTQSPGILLNTLVATAKPTIELSDIYISVKTTRHFHKLRLDLLLKTWVNQAREQVSFRLNFTFLGLNYLFIF